MGETALIYACKNRNYELVQLLINNNADVNIETKQGNTPLIYSCYEKYISKPIVKLLLDNGANLFKQNHHGRTALMMACEGYAIDVVELLLSYYQRNSKSSNTTTTNNNNNNNININKTISSYNASFESVGSNNSSSNGSQSSNNSSKNKMTLCINPIPECAQKYNILFKPLPLSFLTESKNNINYIDMKDKKGETAFIIACRIGAFEIVKLLIQNGCNILVRNKKGNSGFLYACRFS
jgi:ankyrin repeat protein